MRTRVTSFVRGQQAERKGAVTLSVAEGLQVGPGQKPEKVVNQKEKKSISGKVDQTCIYSRTMAWT